MPKVVRMMVEGETTGTAAGLYHCSKEPLGNSWPDSISSVTP